MTLIAFYRKPNLGMTVQVEVEPNNVPTVRPTWRWRLHDQTHDIAIGPADTDEAAATEAARIAIADAWKAEYDRGVRVTPIHWCPAQPPRSE